MQPSRLPELSEIGAPYWDDKPVVIVGSGPSIPQDFDFARLKGKFHVLAVKQTVFELPFADACFAIDHPWMNRKQDELRSQPVPLILSVYNERPRKHPLIDGATYVENRADDGLSIDPRYIHHGGTSGYGAIGAARHKRAKRIILLGYDYRVIVDKNGNEQHHYKNEAYPWYPRRNKRYWERWGRNFGQLAEGLRKEGIEIINASPQSSITVWPRTTIEEALQ